MIKKLTDIYFIRFLLFILRCIIYMFVLFVFYFTIIIQNVLCYENIAMTGGHQKD